MKSVKKTAVLSLFATLLACPLVACTADVAPTEPDGTVVRTVTNPGGGPAEGSQDGNEKVTGTASLRTGVIGTAPYEPHPNPWNPQPGGDDNIPSVGGTPSVTPTMENTPTPRVDTKEDADDEDNPRFNRPANGRKPF